MAGALGCGKVQEHQRFRGWLQPLRVLAQRSEPIESLMNSCVVFCKEAVEVQMSLELVALSGALELSLSGTRRVWRNIDAYSFSYKI